MRSAVLGALRTEESRRQAKPRRAAMIQPDFREFQRLAKQGNLIPVYDVFFRRIC